MTDHCGLGTFQWICLKKPTLVRSVKEDVESYFAESGIRKPTSCFCDLKNIIDRPGPMPLYFAVEMLRSSTCVYESITSSSASYSRE